MVDVEDHADAVDILDERQRVGDGVDASLGHQVDRMDRLDPRAGPRPVARFPQARGARHGPGTAPPRGSAPAPGRPRSRRALPHREPPPPRPSGGRGRRSRVPALAGEIPRAVDRRDRQAARIEHRPERPSPGLRDRPRGDTDRLGADPDDGVEEFGHGHVVGTDVMVDRQACSWHFRSARLTAKIRKGRDDGQTRREGCAGDRRGGRHRGRVGAAFRGGRRFGAGLRYRRRTARRRPRPTSSRRAERRGRRTATSPIRSPRPPRSKPPSTRSAPFTC